jgi:hypothetical protein
MTSTITSAWRNDMDEAHDNATDALNAIEALQATDTWHALPRSVQRTLCASHAALGGITAGLIEAGV